MLKRILVMLMLCFLFPGAALCEEELYIEEFVILDDSGEERPDVEAEMQARRAENPAREDFIDRIIQLGKELYEKSGGKAQRAHYSGDIYVCKNFTVYLFRKCRDDFRMEAYPDTTLVIPDNLPSAQCRPYSYGIAWKSIEASEGNPFYEAASFRYDKSLSKEENMELAMNFMRQVQRGDFFQMSADYDYGVGAHSAIMIADYDAEIDSVHWMDSNMRGKKVDGIRYGIVQFDEVRSVEWWASCFCKKGRGATLYRLRDDIMYAGTP